MNLRFLWDSLWACSLLWSKLQRFPFHSCQVWRAQTYNFNITTQEDNHNYGEIEKGGRRKNTHKWRDLALSVSPSLNTSVRLRLITLTPLLLHKTNLERNYLSVHYCSVTWRKTFKGSRKGSKHQEFKETNMIAESSLCHLSFNRNLTLS